MRPCYFWYYYDQQKFGQFNPCNGGKSIIPIYPTCILNSNIVNAFFSHCSYDISSWNMGTRVAQWVGSLDLTAHTSPSPIRRGFMPSFVNYKKGALDSQPQVIKFTKCLPRVGGSLWVFRLPPPLKLVSMI